MKKFVKAVLVAFTIIGLVSSLVAHKTSAIDCDYGNYPDEIPIPKVCLP